ncbi:Asp/Glu racemase [Mycobacterium sp. AMU20-3851]|jgi:maleate isomerase|uniref:maleate cis-trans isomerase family protein n=1 Tax=Mycobacterium sp. AMU20-3851 TaxID=3122055 RepID=UPI0037546B7C
MTAESHLATPVFATTAPRRIGLVVPSSNTTMETEIPQLLAGISEPHTYHSSRARLHTVDAESLAAMVADGDRCAAELADARVDVIAYACLVAVMAAGPGAHERIEEQLTAVVRAQGCAAPVVSSAGALIRTLADLQLKKVAVVAPYMPALTETVIAYLRGYGVDVVDWVTLGVADNCDVGRLDPDSLLEHAQRLDLSEAEGVVLSACVQMPSLPAVELVENRLGMPVLTAATATTREILRALDLPAVAAGGGRALRSEPVGPVR